MLSTVEKFLFEKFRSMPRWVRVLTYLVLLFLYVYLLLVPRFINGQLIIRDPSSGGFVPYRGVEIQMQIEGRDYKFRSNEAGYWSIPVIARLPEEMEVQIFHEDKSQWFAVTFPATHAWKRRLTRIEISENAPFVRMADGTVTGEPGGLFAAAGSALASLISEANATLILAPSEPSTTAVPSAEKKRIQSEVFGAVAAVLGKKPSEIGANYALTGTLAPTYVQKIQIITQLERRFSLTIPDEHWRSMKKVGDLADYIEKRQILIRENPEVIGKDPKMSWPAIQQTLPPDKRPVFRSY